MPGVSLTQPGELEEVLTDYPRDIGVPEIIPGLSRKQEESELPPRFNYGGSIPRVGRYIDEWGCVRHVLEDGVTGEVKEPLLSNWDALDDLEPPWDFLESTDYSSVNEQCAKSTKFMLSGVCARPFERMQFLRGSENLLRDFILNKEEVLKLRDMVHEYNLEHIKMWLGTDVDGIWLMDDWGQQNNLLISPDMWGELFKSLYREYVELIHDGDKRVFFHSDGWIESIYGEFVDIGVDAINSQLFCMDIERIARLYRGKITFWGELDRQWLLPFATPDQVKQAVYRVRRALDRGDGGVIAHCSWGKYNPKENILAVFEAWNETI
jgi:uroporphyrinogen-III decarboxylase